MILPRLCRSSESPKSPLSSPEKPENDLKLERVYRLCRQYRRGVAAVEFAIVAPVFILMMLGMIELGRAVMVQQIITNASREGARVAVLPGSTGGEVTTRVQNILTASGIGGATVRILSEAGQPINPEDAGFGAVIDVTVSVPFNQVSWLPASRYLAGKNLTASTVMRGERVQ
ncbi:MAG: pilus assembly protein [Planctomycetia bacterium]|nr:pilus assembly protein [Planctomycetia bacterium]